MPKKRRGPELYDMLSPDRQETAQLLEPPAWLSDGPSPTATKVPVSDQKEAGPATISVAADSPAAPRSLDRAPRLAAIEGACLTISLTSRRAAIACCVLIALVAFIGQSVNWYGASRYKAGHEAGRASYLAGTTDEISAARAAPPRTDVVASLLADPKRRALATRGEAPSPLASGSTAWIRGHSYVVAQEFGAGLADDAERAQDFLLQRGIDAEVVPLAGGRVQLITVQGYNLRDQAQKQMAQKLIDRVRRVGEEYFADGGGYRLRGYLKTLTKENW